MMPRAAADLAPSAPTACHSIASPVARPRAVTALALSGDSGSWERAHPARPGVERPRPGPRPLVAGLC